MISHLRHNLFTRKREPSISLVDRYGMLGYGVLWSLYEKMALAGGYLDIDLKGLSGELNVPVRKLRRVVRFLLDKGAISRDGVGAYYSKEVCAQIVEYSAVKGFPPSQGRKRSGTSGSYYRGKYAK